MFSSASRLFLASLISGLVLAGCQPKVSPVAPETEPAERPTRDAMLSDYREALARAEATSGPGAPALWSLSDEDTTLYFFGTVHLLRPELNWRSEAFEAAFAQANTLVFEVDTTSEAAQQRLMTDFMSKGMYQDGRTLRGVLNESDEPVIEAAFSQIGVPLDAMNTFEPWMASVNLSMMKLVKDGFAVDAGVEQVLQAEGQAAGKSFGYLETIAEQAEAFDSLPEAEQITMLYESALLLDESTQMLDLLVDEWADGDVAGIAAMVASPEGVGFSDGAYVNLLVKRNQNWIPRIEAMLDTPGAVFIAVGAGHLAGPDSVIKMLRDKGYEVTGP